MYEISILYNKYIMGKLIIFKEIFNIYNINMKVERSIKRVYKIKQNVKLQETFNKGNR